MNPMMIMAALGAGMLFLMNRGQAGAAPSDDSQPPAAVAPPSAEAPDPFGQEGDDARSVPDLGPSVLESELERRGMIDPKAGDRNGVTPRVDPRVTPEPKTTTQRGPAIVALTKEPTVR